MKLLLRKPWLSEEERNEYGKHMFFLKRNPYFLELWIELKGTTMQASGGTSWHSHKWSRHLMGRMITIWFQVYEHCVSSSNCVRTSRHLQISMKSWKFLCISFFKFCEIYLPPKKDICDIRNPSLRNCFCFKVSMVIFSPN